MLLASCNSRSEMEDASHLRHQQIHHKCVHMTLIHTIKTMAYATEYVYYVRETNTMHAADCVLETGLTLSS